MAPHVILDFYLVVDGVNLSAWVKGMNLPNTFTEIDDSTMGATTKVTIAGAEEWEVSVDLEQDYVAAGPFWTLWPKKGQSVALELRPTSAAGAAGNPVFTGDAVLMQMTSVGGNWNEKHMTRALFRCAGPLTVTPPPALFAASEATPPTSPTATVAGAGA